MKEITANQYLQLCGLLTLAQKHYTMLRSLEVAMQDILGDDAEQWIGDAIYGNENFDADWLLERLEMGVVDAD